MATVQDWIELTNWALDRKTVTIDRPGETMFFLRLHQGQLIATVYRVNGTFSCGCNTWRSQAACWHVALVCYRHGFAVPMGEVPEVGRK